MGGAADPFYMINGSSVNPSFLKLPYWGLHSPAGPLQCSSQSFVWKNASHTNTRANKTEMDCQCKNGTLMLKEAKPLTKVQQEPTRKNNNPKVRKVKKKTQTKREIIKEQANAIKTITSVRKVTQKARESTKSHKKNLQNKAVNCKKGPRINSKRPRDQTGWTWKRKIPEKDESKNAAINRINTKTMTTGTHGLSSHLFFNSWRVFTAILRAGLVKSYVQRLKHPAYYTAVSCCLSLHVLNTKEAECGCREFRVIKRLFLWVK